MTSFVIIEIKLTQRGTLILGSKRRMSSTTTSPFKQKSTIQPKGLNMKDPKVRAELYMQTHGIKELFESMGTLLLFHRPENPRAFLAQHLADVQRVKKSQRHVGLHSILALDLIFRGFGSCMWVLLRNTGAVLRGPRPRSHIRRVRRHGSGLHQSRAIRPRYFTRSVDASLGSLSICACLAVCV